MQIVIPMSGYGERFRAAGYEVPKPLIEVEGKPIISHVVDLFPGEDEILFICNRDHLENPAYRMGEILGQLASKGEVIAIDPHKKGPVHAVLQIRDKINLGQPVIVNYCDFTCYWDYHNFKNFVRKSGCDGCIPAYRGFHPHSLGNTRYAYLKHDNLWATDIQEKKPFTDNPIEEFASSGTYYFRTGQIMLDCMDEIVKAKLDVNGEYYVSLAYKPLLDRIRPVAIYELQHFMQWGTPQDLSDYRYYSSMFEQLAGKRRPRPRHGGALVVPMAGLGARFSEQGYLDPKPLIPVSGKPMVTQAVAGMPIADKKVPVLRRDLPGVGELVRRLGPDLPIANIIWLDRLSEGQADTAAQALDELAPEMPLAIVSCDSGSLYEPAKFEALWADQEVDLIVWGARNHPSVKSAAYMYSWIDCNDDGVIARVSLKAPVDATLSHPIVTGSFTFRRAADFARAHSRSVSLNMRVNGEYYIDTCVNTAINLGMKAVLMEVEYFMSWGTPEEYETFQYWQSCFHKWPQHTYSLDSDAMVPPEALERLRMATRPLKPKYPPRWRDSSMAKQDRRVI